MCIFFVAAESACSKPRFFGQQAATSVVNVPDTKKKQQGLVSKIFYEIDVDSISNCYDF